MARKLKTFQTSISFYDLAIAAPSMKAALDAWGAGSNLFHQGAAKETDEPDVVAATMFKPGVVLKRPAGSTGRFAEHSDLPSDLGSEARPPRRSKGHRREPKKKRAAELSERQAQKAAADFDKEQRRREAERRREEAAQERDRDRRQKAIARAQAALEKGEREHAKRARAIQAEVEALDRRSESEDDLWMKESERLRAALRRARD